MELMYESFVKTTGDAAACIVKEMVQISSFLDAWLFSNRSDEVTGNIAVYKSCIETVQ